MEKIIQKAIHQTTKVEGYKYLHGAVIFRDNAIVSVGHNMKMRVPELKKYGYERIWHHAESHAILKAHPEDLVGSELLVIRKCKTKLGSSKPCPHCTGLIRESGIKRVYYSDTDGSIKEFLV